MRTSQPARAPVVRERSKPVGDTPIAKAVRHLEAGQWQDAHALVQKDSTAEGCWAHGIVHLVEGDLENAKYWYRRARRPLPDGNTAAAEIAALKAALRVPRTARRGN